MSRIVTLAVAILFVSSAALAQVSDPTGERYEGSSLEVLRIQPEQDTRLIRLAEGEYSTALPRGEGIELVFVTVCEDGEFTFCPVTSYDFGTVATGARGPYHTPMLQSALGKTVNPLYLLNLSETETATNLSIHLDTQHFQWSVPPTPGGCRDFNEELPPGQACDVIMRFAPTEFGPMEGSLSISSSEGAQATVMLHGTGGDDVLLHGQFHDWETMPQFTTVANARYPGMPDRNAELADDFVVEDPEGWTINVIGIEYHDLFAFLGMGLSPFEVYIVPDDNGFPGEDPICSAPESQVLWYDPHIEKHTDIVLSEPCTLPPGHYWLRARPVLDNFFNEGYWVVHAPIVEPPGAPPIHLNPPVWRNPGGFFNENCPEWTYMYPPACTHAEWFPIYGALFWLIGEGEPATTGPVNDHIADATFIPIRNDTYTGTNVNATLEDGEPEPSCTFSDWTTNFSVWWTFTADEEANRITIDTFDSEFDTIISLHRASNLEEVACNDDTNGVQSQIENASIVAGETYLIRVAGYNESSGNQGDIQLTTAFHWVSGEDGPNEIVQGLTHPSPNPVRETASFTLAVEHRQQVTVEVFDVMGRRVQVLYEGSLAAGATETLRLDASRLPSGVYVIRALGEDFVDTRRVTVVH